MSTSLDEESEKLKGAWLQYPPEFLDTYLVQSVENPCLNPQSILLRSLIIETLAPGKFTALIEQEMLYAACVCTTIHAAQQGLFDPFTAALENEPGADAILPLPEFIKRVRASPSAHPFSLRDIWQQVLYAQLHSYNGFKSPFETLWCEQLSSLTTQPIKFLETACGSANDYRYFERYGLDAFVDYTGGDICATNIANALKRCPKGTFLEADARTLPFSDKNFDFYCVFDLFEHLSIEAFQSALREASRVTRNRMWLSFFQLELQPEHTIVPHPPYHLNILSYARTSEVLAKLGWNTRLIDLPPEWSKKFPGYCHYNPRARIIEARPET